MTPQPQLDGSPTNLLRTPRLRNAIAPKATTGPLPTRLAATPPENSKMLKSHRYDSIILNQKLI